MFTLRQHLSSLNKFIGIAPISIGLIIIGLLYIVSLETDLRLTSLISAAEAPDAPTDLDLNNSDDTGFRNNDNITSQKTDLTITGCAEADSTITYYNGDTAISDTVIASGANCPGGKVFTKDISLNGVDDEGENIITVTATKDSLISTKSDKLKILIDTTAPTVKSAEGQYYSNDSLTSLFSVTIATPFTDIYTRVVFNDNMARVNSGSEERPVINYKIGSEVTKYDMVASSTDLTSGTCHATGAGGACTDTYICLYTTKAGDDGAFKFEVSTDSEDRAGNNLATAYSHPVTVTVDVPGQAAPSQLTAPDLKATSDSNITDDDITSDDDPEIIGTGATVVRPSPSPPPPVAKPMSPPPPPPTARAITRPPLPTMPSPTPPGLSLPCKQSAVATAPPRPLYLSL